MKEMQTPVLKGFSHCRGYPTNYQHSTVERSGSPEPEVAAAGEGTLPRRGNTAAGSGCIDSYHPYYKGQGKCSEWREW